MKFISGYKHPKIRVYDFNNALVANIELPITGAEGLIESVEEKKIIHELTNYTFLEKVFGYRLTWTLPYTEYANKDTMLKVQNILRYHRAGYRINLTPRADDIRRNFNVIYSGENFEYGIKKGGINSIGNRLVKISFTTKDLVYDLNLTDPDLRTYTVWLFHNRLGIIT